MHSINTQEWINANLSNFTIFEKENNDGFISIIKGIKYINNNQNQNNCDNKIYKFISYNNFEELPIIIPDNYIERVIKNKDKWLKDIVNKYYCGSKKIIKNKSDIVLNNYMSDHINDYNNNICEKYFTHDNGGRPFLVYIYQTKIFIYKQSEEYYLSDEIFLTQSNDAYFDNINGDNNVNDDSNINNEDNIKEDIDWTYTELVDKIDFEKIYIGKSPINKTTKFSGGSGKDFDGNSFLLKLKDLEYVYIGERIYSFIAYDEIIRYISPVGGNDVPYPWAVDKDNNYYLMLENIIMTKRPKNIDPYEYYYKNSKINEKYYWFKKKISDNLLEIINNTEKNHISLDDLPKYANELGINTSQINIDFILKNFKNENETENENETISINFNKLIYWVLSENLYNMSYTPKPEEHYNWILNELVEYPYIKRNNNLVFLTKEEYIKIIDIFRIKHEYKLFKNVKLICERQI